MEKKTLDRFAVIMGILLLGVGLSLLKLIVDPQGILLVLPYVCIGLGCGMFGHGLGNVMSRRVAKNNPELQKQMKIDKNDERNVAISNKAKAKAYDIMLYVFGALMVSFALMGVDMIAVLLLVFAYLFVVGFFIY
ncbi:hypothetical protein DFP94_10280 [Fontibacillus phaseoli]|uniref:Uncharacterized protein n=2 Tax=Fontibacillus phaseoli TaxID=1416533 RepID=A0A369BNT0_9BACL|nr:hypothetical protein DFP94_10280 [Fontibacillus phaseoli]